MGWQVVGSCLFFWLAEHSIQAIIIIHLEVCDICDLHHRPVVWSF